MNTRQIVFALALVSFVPAGTHAQEVTWTGNNTNHVSSALSYSTTQQLGDYDSDGGTDDSRRFGAAGPGFTTSTPLQTQVTGLNHIMAGVVFNIGGLAASAGSGSVAWRDNVTFDATGTLNDDIIRFTNTSSIASTQYDLVQGIVLFQNTSTGTGTALSSMSAFSAVVKNNFNYVSTNEVRWVVYDATLANYYVSNTVYNLSTSTAITTYTKNTGFDTETWAVLPTTTFNGSLSSLFDSNTASFSSISLSNITYAGIFVNSRYDYGTSAGGASIDFAAFSADLQVAAIPEPSTYAALAGLAALGLVAYRRRQQRAT